MLADFMKHHGLTLGVFVGAIVTVTPLRAQENLEDHPALARYPSPEEWRRRIEEAKRERPEELATARADFDTAIRSIYVYKLYPQAPLEFRGRWELRPNRVLTREDVADFIAKSVDQAQKAFFREHLEELVVDDSPMLRVALADALLNEWEDWSAWTDNQQLEELRRKFPRLHRCSAWLMANRLRVVELNGLALRAIISPTSDAFLEVGDRRAAEMMALRDRNIDVLDYLLRASARCDNKSHQVRLASMARSFDNRDAAALRDVWAPYLTHESDVIRAEAVLRVGEMVRRIRVHSRGQDAGEELQTRLRQLADTDPDQEVRDRAKYALDAIQEAP